MGFQSDPRLRNRIRSLPQYKQWRFDVINRDGKCMSCGSTELLEAHHLISFKTIIEKYEVETLAQAFLCTQLWDLNNGQTLCSRCHARVLKGSRKPIKRAHISKRERDFMNDLIKGDVSAYSESYRRKLKHMIRKKYPIIMNEIIPLLEYDKQLIDETLPMLEG